MGDIIKAYQFDQNDTANMMKPIIYCDPSKEINDSAYSVSIPIAKELQKYDSPMMRTMRLESSLLAVIGTFDDEPVIKEIDVLFNPSYQTDVLKLLISACRKKPFSIIWPGRYEDGRLYYAEEGYEDYKVYEVSNYDITVVI